MRIINLLKYIFVFCPVLLFAQNYHPLLKENRTWDDLSVGNLNSGSCDYGSRIFIIGDTTISNTVYKKMSYQRIFMENPWPVCYNLVIDTVSYPITDMFLREDSLLKQVFIISEQNNYEEEIIYDFSLSVGDTLKSTFANHILTNIDSIRLLNGESRRRFLFHSEWYIEGIGGQAGLLKDIQSVFLGFTQVLKCVKENNIPIWRRGDECDYHYLANKDISNKRKIEFQMYFQPVQNQIVVKSDIKNEFHFKLYDLQGKCLIERSFFGSEHFLNIPNLNNGVYIGVILQDGVLLGSKKVVLVKK